VYFGSVAYGLGATAIPIADDGNTYLAAPDKPEECNTDDNTGFAYLRAGWGGRAVYKQVVSLPCAQYRLEYWIYNANYEGSKNNTNVKNLCKVTCRDDVFVDSLGFNEQNWTKHTINFTPTADFTIEFGFESSGGSGSNPFVCIDGIRLYKTGEADQEMLLQSDINNYVERINQFKEENLSSYPGVCDQIDQKLEEFSDITIDADIDAMIEAFHQIQAYYTEVQGYQAIVDELYAAVEAASALLDAPNPYPGIDAFIEACTKAANTLDDGNIDDIKAQIEALKTATNAYYMSQKATPDNPADFSFNIDNPMFVAKGSWYIGQTGGDQRLNTLADNNGESITCWNAWRNDLSSPDRSVSVSQDLTGLPNGIYKVSADMCTQDGCITDQHLFAKGTASTAESAVMTTTGWNPYTWETLTTTEVVVVDGKLTIGAIGHGKNDKPSNNGGTDTDSRMGWFCVTNFKLSYLGEATAEQYAAAVQTKIADAKAYGEAMHLAADRDAFLAVANAAKTIDDLEALNAALAIAEESENEYLGIISGSYQNLKDSIATSTAYTANAKKVAQVPVDYVTAYLASATATYKETPALTTITRYYRDTLIPALLNAENTQINDATGKAALQGTIDAVVAQLGSYIDNTDDLAALVNQLNAGIQIAQLADVDYGAGKDVTVYIANPAIDSESGWSYNRPVGDKNSTTSQGVDGVSSNRYLDCWQAAAGTTRYTAYQTLNVPNGKYKLSNIMRASGEGVYLFASDKAPVKDADDNLTLDPAAKSVLAAAVANVTAAKYLPGAEKDSVVTDAYGEIWMAAADKVMAKFGVTSATESTTIYDLVLEANDGNDTCPEGIDAADWSIFMCNGGKGRGWFNNSLEIEVTDHVLTIGVTCDSVFTSPVATAVPFTGTWFSADNFVLTMITPGTNTGWNPATSVEAVDTTAEPTAVYTLTGARSNGLQKGINIIKMSNGQTKKIIK